MQKVTKKHRIQGKERMKLAAVVALETKNDMMRRDGFAPSQWGPGRFPHRPGGLTEESEWGQFGVLSAQQDSTTRRLGVGTETTAQWTPWSTKR